VEAVHARLAAGVVCGLTIVNTAAAPGSDNVSAKARIPVPFGAVRHMNSASPIHLQSGDALIAVDVQNDFLPGGSLAVPQGDAVVPALNRYLAAFAARALPVFATRDWHPARHCSFKAQGGIWPPHCIARTSGAEFALTLALPQDAVIISKAATSEADSYSGFGGTNLAERLRDVATRLFIGGLATDYCVLNTVKDAIGEGFEVLLLVDAIRAVDVQPGDGARAEREMQQLGARPIRFEDLAP
jgi:nicotinamidase/pyrazinamidase